MANVPDILDRVARLVADARDEAELARRGVELCLAITGIGRGALAVAGRAERSEILHNHGVPLSYLKFLQEQYMNLPGARIIASGQAITVRDVLSEPGYELFREAYESASIRGMMLLPLRQAFGGVDIREVEPEAAATFELFGVLGLYHDAPIDVSDDALGLANLVAEQVALGLCNFRLHRDREHYKREAVLERSQQVVGTLTAGIAHDLNNVMGTVLGVMELMPRLDPPKQRELLEQLEGQVHHATGLTRSLLELSRVSRSAEDDACDPTVIARQAVEMVRASAHPDTLLEVREESPCLVAIPSMALARIFLNLLLNAIQAIGHRSGGRVVVTIGPRERRCVITVDDNGPGVEPEHAEVIFEPFASFNKRTGTGIGLTSARGLAERAGGTLALRHREGPGACLVLELDCERVASALVPTPTPSAPSEASFGVGGEGRSILLAEDEPVQRKAFADALRAAGYDVTAVATGTSAAEMIDENEYELLILDQRMPGLTGFEVLERARRAGRDTPALMVSGFNVDPTALSGLGHVSIVSKPLSGEALVRRLEETLPLSAV